MKRTCFCMKYNTLHCMKYLYYMNQSINQALGINHTGKEKNTKFLGTVRKNIDNEGWIE